ncbi:MAG: hypothetical protein P8048_09495 [Calditrichia bacterium]
MGADVSTLLLEENQIPDLQIKETQTYAGKELYGYIDGGAEIYLEYGFVKLAESSLRDLFRFQWKLSCSGLPDQVELQKPISN